MKKNPLTGYPTCVGWQKILRIMKLTTFLILLLVCQVSASVYSQNHRISVEAQDLTLSQIFKKIEQSSDFRFIYQNEQVVGSERKSIHIKNRGVEDILNNLLTNTGLSYRIIDKHILVYTKGADGNVSQVDKIKISGTVTDRNGEPLPGVSIVIKGTTLGITTNIDGGFAMNNVSPNATLIFSFVGMKRMEIPVAGQSSFKIVMEEDAIGLEEVVAVGYGTQKKVNLTGAVASVSSEVLESRPVATLGQGLQGSIPNLIVTTSNGSPGKGASYNIRGGTSINGGSPLVLVDGVQMDPNLLNPDDIKSVSVLKDAASAAIYGARAAFGVVLITTKNGGKKNQMKINYSGNLSFTAPTKLPEYVNSLDYVTMMNTASINAGSGQYFNDNYIEHVKKYLANPTPENAVFLNPNNPDKYLYCGNTDWIDVMYDDYAVMHKHTVSISGGGEKTSYYASGGYLDQDGFIAFADEEGFKRYNTNLNVRSDINDWLSVSAKTIFNHTSKITPYGTRWFSGAEAGFISSDLRPLMPVYHPDGNFSGQGSFTNMAAVAQLSGDLNSKINDLWLSGALQLKPIKGLLVNFDYTFNFYSNVQKGHRKEIVEHYANPDLTTLYPWTKPSYAEMKQSDDYYNALNLWAEYEKTFQKHYFKLLVGFNQEKKHNRWNRAQRMNLINNNLPALNQAIGDQFVGYSESEWAIRGAFYRLNYRLNDKYLLELNGRYDGTSKFPSDDRFKFFPSVSAGWRISKENFFNPLTTWVDDLKLRASYGSLGNQKVSGNYPYISTLGTSSQSGYILNGQQPISVHPSGLVSSNLTWETVNQYNFGFDLTMLDQRLNAGFDWYTRETKDMLTGGQPLPAVLGTGVPLENAADLETVGWELSLSWKDKINDDLSYHLNFVLSDYQTEITKYDNPNGLLNRYYVGRKFGEIWGFKTHGLFQSDEEVANSPSQSQIWGGQWKAGDVRYVDVNNDGKITRGNQTLENPGDLSIIGNSTPRYQFGLRAGATWKNLSVDVFFQGVAKRDYMPGGNYFWGTTSEWSVPQQHSLDYWTESNPGAYWPRPRFGQWGNWQTQTRYLQDASYIRLKQLTVGYDLPKKLLRKWNIKGVKVYFTGENLFEFTDLLDAYDPEVLNATTYPLYRSYSVGLNITL
ncbi:SusC/RagA family TonB-linked outer membrane protein [Prolixibacteraceae bacterium JC049]|nr:SusC/RagA family TonB-linked outer membrane protein [Prolixibacteraceae bacterium JC049]